MLHRFLRDDDGLCQLRVKIISAVFDGYGAAASAVGNHRNGFTTVATQGEQKRIQLFIVGLDPLNDILFSFLCGL